MAQPACDELFSCRGNLVLFLRILNLKLSKHVCGWLNASSPDYSFGAISDVQCAKHSERRIDIQTASLPPVRGLRFCS